MRTSTVQRYAKITVASAMFLGPLGGAAKDRLAEVFAQMRFALRERALTEALMWDTVSALLHEGFARCEVVPDGKVYALTPEGDMWLVARLHEFGESDGAFRIALARCELDPEAVIGRMNNIMESLRTMAEEQGTETGQPVGDTYLGLVAWRMRWEPSRQYSVPELVKTLGLNHAVIEKQIDAAMRMDWFNVHNRADGERAYSLTSLGVAGATRMMSDVMQVAALAEGIAEGLGLVPNSPRGKRPGKSKTKQR